MLYSPFFAFALILLPAQAELSLEERFRTEAPRAWQEYIERMQKFQGPITVSFSGGAKRRVLIKQRPGCALFLLEEIVGGTNTDRTETCQVINPRYGFTLKRPNPNRQWFVSQMELRDQSSQLQAPTENLDFFDELVYSPVTFLAIHYIWKDLPQQPGFIVKSAAPEKKEGKPYIKVTFQFKPEVQHPRNPRAKGWVLFDPNLYWIIREYDTDLFFWDKQKSKEIQVRKYGSFEYEENRDGFPVVKRRTFNAQNVQRDQEPVKTVWEYKLEEKEPPESDFYLSAFGLPEPSQIKNRTPWYLWLMLAGLLCLGIAAFFRWKARRAESVPARPQPEEEA
jgi:hypothetical protein